MVRQKGQEVGGGKKKPEGPEDRKNREGVEIKLEGQIVPDQAECYRNLDFSGTPK